MEQSANIETVNFRLTSIEATLSELKAVIVENKLQEKEIKDIKEKLVECLQAFNSHDKRIRNLEIKPIQDKASKWQTITDMVFKWAISAGIAYFAIKMGFKS
jgi:galactose-1-phosphate uridylyltransferase